MSKIYNSELAFEADVVEVLQKTGRISSLPTTTPDKNSIDVP